MQHRILIFIALLTASTMSFAMSNDTGDAAVDYASTQVLVRSGQTLSGIFTRNRIPARTLIRLLSSAEHAVRLQRLQPGDRLEFKRDSKGMLSELVLHPDVEHFYTFSKTDSGFSSRLDTIELRVQIAEARGVISDNLYDAARGAGLSNSLVAKLAGVFAWDIDLSRDLRRGAHLTVIYQELYLDGRKVRDGHVLAAELINRGRAYRAVRYQDPHGSTAYYTPEGRSVQKAFLRSPIEFARVSSRFNRSRRHPTLHKVRAHQGVDYAATTGTPIRATADGTVRYRGKKGAYGRAVVLGHGGQRSTLYAHLSRFNAQVRKGTRVRQGQIIGYVGSSGLVTGPHLHYEFRVAGIYKDPLSVELPQGKPVPVALHEDFVRRTSALARRLEATATLTLAAR